MKSKRLAGVTALLIVLVAFVIPYARDIVSSLTIPQPQPFALNIGQAIWLASLLLATIIFLIASLYPKTRARGLGLVFIGATLIGLGWYYQKADQLESSAHPNDSNRDKDPDVPKMRADLEKLIPLQTPLAEVKRRMESFEFSCTVVDEIHYPPKLQTMSVKPAIDLYCKKDDRWPLHRTVTRRWNVQFSFPFNQSPNPGVVAMYVSCAHYFGRIFLFWTFCQDESRFKR